MPTTNDEIPLMHRSPSRNILGLLIVMAVAAFVAVAASSGDDEPAGNAATSTVPAAPLVREESHRLSDAPADAPVFVEFLDFECEACGGVFPAIEALRAQYGDRVQFVVRYFPLRNHLNAERAARAVEAAARQGKFEEMYRTMFETQKTWGDQNVVHDALFRSFAEKLGLDLARFDRDYADPSTAQRVAIDLADGLALGVNSTPTFYLNGRRLQPKSSADLANAFDAALASVSGVNR